MTNVVDEHVQALRAAVQALKDPQAVKRAPAPRSSVFGRAAAAVPADVRPPAPRTTLQGRLNSVETSALLPGTTMALLVLPDEGAVPASLLVSLQLLVSAGAVAVLLGRDLPRDVPTDRSRPLTLPLRDDDSLAREWGLIAAGPTRRIAFLARREPTAPETWSWLLTRDSVAIHRAGTAILERVPFLRLRIPPLSD